MTDVDPHLQQAVVRLVRALDAMQRREGCENRLTRRPAFIAALFAPF